MIFVASAAGYLIGSLPTADSLGRLWGFDLRQEGSGNPGANNAFRVGGPALGASVLLIELAKGLLAVTSGTLLAGDPGAVAAAVAAVAGNVYNIWYRLRGGKGLAISGGALLGAAPALILPVLAVLVVVAAATRSSGLAALTAIVVMNGAAVLWWLFEWSAGWGVMTGPLLSLIHI